MRWRMVGLCFLSVAGLLIVLFCFVLSGFLEPISYPREKNFVWNFAFDFAFDSDSDNDLDNGWFFFKSWVFSRIPIALQLNGRPRGPRGEANLWGKCGAARRGGWL